VLVPRDQVTSMGLKQVRIEHATPHTLYGRVATPGSDAYVPLAMAS